MSSCWSDVPPSRGIWWPRAVLHQVSLTCAVRCTQGLVHLSSDIHPSRGIWWPRAVLHQVNLTCAVRHTQGLVHLSSHVPPSEPSRPVLRSCWHDLRCTFCRLLPRALLISDDKSSSSKVVPWCSNTSDWWCKDMCKLVWRVHIPYNISLHCVQEYVIRQHRYKTAYGH